MRALLEHSPAMCPSRVGSGKVTVVAFTRPFRDRKTVIECEAGQTIERMLEQAGISPYRGCVMAVWVGDVRVERSWWGRVYPKAGSIVAVKMLLLGGGGEGGGKDGVGIAISIVLAIALPYAGAGLAGWISSMQFVGSGLLASGLITASHIGSAFFASAAASSLMSTGTAPSLGALSGTESQRRESPTLFIAGARNQASPYGVIPRVYGRHRVTPPLGATQYPDMDGNEQHLVALFCIGYGPLMIEQLRLGENPIDQIDDVKMEVFEGWETDPASDIYEGVVRFDDYSILLEKDEPIVRTSAPDVTKINIDFVFARGLIEIDDEGKRKKRKVRVEIKMRRTGTDDPWREYFDGEFEGKTQQQLRVEKRFAGLVRAQYDIMITRKTEEPPDDENIYDDVYLASIRSTDENMDAVRRRGLAMVAMNIRASEQLNGNIDDFNCVVTSCVEADADSELILSGDAYAKTYDSDVARTGRSARTIEMWAKLASTGTDGKGGLFQMGSFGVENRDFALTVNSSGYPVMRFGSSSLDVTVTEAGSVVDDAWHHHAMTYDGTDARYYLDGVMVKTVTRSSLNTSTSRIYIGRYKDHDDEYFMDGRVRGVRLWSYARTADDIADNLNVEMDTRRPGLVGSWLFIEGYGERTVDFSQRGHHLKLIGGYEWAASDRAARTMYVPTSNPALIFRDILTGSANARPISTARLDTASLDEWETYCNDNGLEFNHVVDYSTTVAELLRDVCAAGHAAPTMIDGKFGVVIDREKSTVIQHFSPRNVISYSGRFIFTDQPHALLVRLTNEERDWEPDEITVYDDGYTADNATKFERMDFKGLTTREENWKFGRRTIASTRLRPETHEIQVDCEHIRCTRGDLVRFSHDVIRSGIGAGRITSLVRRESDGHLIAIGLDEKLSFESAKTYVARIRAATGAAHLGTLATEEGEFSTLRFAAALDDDGEAAVGDLVLIGESGSDSRLCLVKEIRPAQDMQATLTLIDYAPAIFDADTGEIPPWDPDSTIQGPINYPSPPIILRVESNFTVNYPGPDGTLANIRAMIEYTYAVGNYEPVESIEVERRLTLYPDMPVDPPLRFPANGNAVYVDGLEVGETYTFRLRTISRLGRVSPWSGAVDHTIVGYDLAPRKPIALDASMLQTGQAQITWELGPQPPNVIGAKLRIGLAPDAAWEDMLPIHTGVLANSPYLYIILSGAFSLGVVAVNSQGDESEPLLINKALENPIYATSYWWTDAKALGWPGTITGGRVDADGNLVANSSDTWETLPATWEEWTSWSMNPATIVYQIPTYDWGAPEFGFTPPITTKLFTGGVTAEGTAIIEYRYSDDDMSYSSWVELTTATDITGRYVQVRVTVTPPPAGKLTQFILGFLLPG